jgi:chemotaxis protein CheD
MLPRHPPGGRGKLDFADELRYVDFAIRDLATQFDALGARRRDIEVKVFGGADVLQVHSNASRPTVGRLNREMAMEVLCNEGFAVTASRLGGPVGFHIDFYTETGEVLLRQVG